MPSVLRSEPVSIWKKGTNILSLSLREMPGPESLTWMFSTASGNRGGLGRTTSST